MITHAMFKRWLVVLSRPADGELHVAESYATRSEAQAHVESIKRWWPDAHVRDSRECWVRIYSEPADPTTGQHHPETAEITRRLTTHLVAGGSLTVKTLDKEHVVRAVDGATRWPAVYVWRTSDDAVIGDADPELVARWLVKAVGWRAVADALKVSSP